MTLPLICLRTSKTPVTLRLPLNVRPLDRASLFWSHSAKEGLEKPALLEIYKTTIIAAIQLFKIIIIELAGANSSAWCELRVAHCQAENLVLELYFEP